MRHPDNHHIADRLEEAARVFREQGNRFRVGAYLWAAAVVCQWPEPLTEIFAKQRANVSSRSSRLTTADRAAAASSQAASAERRAQRPDGLTNLGRSRCG
jgi:hypothetical protein